MFETQKSRNKTSSGDVNLNIRTLASPKVGQEQVSGGVSVPVKNYGLLISIPSQNVLKSFGELEQYQYISSKSI